jgi:metal transporter CNNM
VLAASSDDPKEQLNAQKVLRLMKKGRHWVLVVSSLYSLLVRWLSNTMSWQVLLLGNVIVNESLPIFLDSAVSALPAGEASEL